MKPLIIQGSSRSDGNTATIIKELRKTIDADLIDLKRHRILHYDYDGKNSSDDFMKLAEQMTQRNKVIFASPVYWYSMSGLMKVFFDRMTDLLDYRKELARQLAEKEMYVISCGNSADPGNGFDLPFVQTAAYLRMRYQGYLHTWLVNGKIPEEVKLKIKQFV